MSKKIKRKSKRAGTAKAKPGSLHPAGSAMRHGKWDWSQVFMFINALEPIMPRAEAMEIATVLDCLWKLPNFHSPNAAGEPPPTGDSRKPKTL